LHHKNTPFYFAIICILKSPTSGWPRFSEMRI
jgi:hypothetical protein